MGLSAFLHDSAACILRGSELVAAVEEERFTRRKHQGGIPKNAFRWCLDAAEISIQDISAVAVGIDPVALSSRRSAFDLDAGSGDLTETQLRFALGIEAPIHFVAHHRAHAASAYHYSPFAEAAVLVADGVGDWPCTSLWHGRADRLDSLDSWDFPDSLGLFYATITSWLGFRVNHDEYKVMGLAAHGAPSLTGLLSQALVPHESRSYALDLAYFAFLSSDTMYSDQLIELIGPPRHPHEPLTDHHRNVAASAQLVLEERLLSLAFDAYERVGSAQLCMAGGVALNAVANARLVKDGPYDDIFFQPAAGDAGTALGAASSIMLELDGARPEPMVDARLGPSFATEDAIAIAAGAGVDCRVLDDHGLVEAAANLIADGAVLGWFRGPMEFGPRALGARSVLADPRSATTRDRINLFMKGRERWRPLAPVVAADRALEYFDTDRSLRFMVETAQVNSKIPLEAVTHLDGSARPQKVDSETMPVLSALLNAVAERIGVAALISTSFNHASEPIVMTPQQALSASSRLGLDALIVENCLITELQHGAFDRVAQWQTNDQPNGSTANLYPL